MTIEGRESARRAAESQSAILSAQDLHKSYDGRPALRGLSFSLEAGHVLGFLGPNGAGKTTAIRILTTVLEPDSGQFVVDGTSSRHPEEIRRKVGVLPESQGFPKQITGIEYLSYFGQHFGRTAAEAKNYGLALLEEVGLERRGRSLIGSYSRGMRQRLGIARALVNDPVVTFLDEPTLGLDPRGQQELLALVRRIARERNVGVVLCSHLLSEIEAVCDDVVILNLGQVVAKGSVAEVAGQAGRSGVRVHVPPSSVEEAQQVLGAMPNVARVTINAAKAGWLQVDLVEVSSNSDHASNGVLEGLLRADIPVLTFDAEGGRLQDVFLHVTEEAIQ